MDATYALILETVRSGTGGECRFDEDVGEAWVCELRLDDQSFLAVRPKDASSELVFYADFGEIPQANEREHLRRILELNLALADSGRAGFGLDAETGHLVYALRASAHTSPGTLRLALENIARQARSWRQTPIVGAHVPGMAQLDPASLA